MAISMQPIRTWKKTAEEMDESGISQIHRGEMVEVPQGGDEPSKFLYKDMGGHTYWVSLMPFELEVN